MEARSSRRFSVLMIVVVVLTSTNSFAQSTTAGKDFWLAFPQNAKYEFGQTIKQSVVVTALEDAEVTVIAPAMSKAGKTLAPGRKIRKGESYAFELDSSLQCLKSEEVDKKGIHVGSTGLISVIALSSRKASNDSYRIMPTEALGREYMIVGYEAPKTDESFTTQFTVIATEDNTSVAINLTSSTNQGHRPGERLEIKLDRGQCYSVQGKKASPIERDLSGSVILSDKPVAMVTGHSCAQVPYDKIYCDVLIEMAAPLQNLGVEYVTPMMEEKDGYALRIVATQPNTVIQGNVDLAGSTTIKLNTGEYADMMLTSNSHIRSNQPIIVAQYALSNEADSNKIGDPFMTLIAPTIAYTSSSTFSTPPLQGNWHHYLSIVCDQQAANSLELNDNAVPSSLSKKVDGGQYVVFQFAVEPGVQTVTSNGKLAVYSYGFGNGSDNFDSYGTYCGPW